MQAVRKHSMIEFIKDDEVLRREELKSVDPLTLETYGELLQANRSLLFCMLVCDISNCVYPTRNIIGMRYMFSGAISVYRMRDPATRGEVKDILYFEVINNPLFCEDRANEADGEGELNGGIPWILQKKELEEQGTQEMLKEGNLIIKAVFLGNELDLLCSLELQDKVFRGRDHDITFSSALLGGLTLLCGSVLLFFFLAVFFCFLMRLLLFL